MNADLAPAPEGPPAPAEPPPGRLLVYTIPLAIVTGAGLIGVAFMPYLLARAPLGLIALSPLFRHLVLVSPSVNALELFAVAVPRHFLPDPFVYMLGRDYGPVAISWIEANSPGMGKLVRRLERLFAAVGPFALLVSPDLIVSTLAGAARVRIPVFVAMNIAGTIANVVVARFFGAQLESQIQWLVAFFQKHLFQVTAASVVLFLIVNWLSSRKGPSGAAEPDGE